METLITGCERSGTKMLLEMEGGGDCEPKLLPALYRAYQHLVLYERSSNIIGLISDLPSSSVQKHSLNLDQNLGFLVFCKEIYPDVKIKYIERDPVAVVQSMIFKLWKYPEHTKSIDEAIYQYNLVRNSCLPWAKDNGEIYQYEDYKDNKIVLPDNVVDYIRERCEY